MTLGLLVGRFGHFLEEQIPVADAAPASPAAFPDGLDHLREDMGHHLVVLTLLARCDGEFADVERDVIVRHCVARAGKLGVATSGETAKALEDYLRSYKPARMQLGPALKRLEHGSKEELVELLAAAQAVIEADGIVRPSERKLLDELQADLKAL